MLLCLPTVQFAVSAPISGADRTYHVSSEERRAIDSAMRRAAKWLTVRQDDRGAILPELHRELCPVLLTGMCLWAIAEVDSPVFPQSRRLKAVGYLCRHRQSDGGFYDPHRGLAVYTTGVVAKALRSVNRQTDSRQIAEFLQGAENFVDQGLLGRAWSPAVDGLIEKAHKLSAGESEAMSFLTRIKPSRETYPGATKGGKDASLVANLAPFVFTEMVMPEPRAVRLYQAALVNYSLDTPSPLTTSFAEGKLLPHSGSLYFYYLALAKALDLSTKPVIQHPGGGEHDWPRELAERLLNLQTDEGYWATPSTPSPGKAWQEEPVLATSYAMLALRRCRDAASQPPAVRR